LQTTFTAAMSSIPLNWLPRGSSLLNSTRFVVQAIAVATLATILASRLSPEVKAQQDKMSEQSLASASAPFGICETPGVKAEDNLPPSAVASLASLPPALAKTTKTATLAFLQQACAENMHGFEDAYRLTFYASIGALILGLFLPGWPARWGGRGSTQRPMPGD